MLTRQDPPFTEINSTPTKTDQAPWYDPTWRKNEIARYTYHLRPENVRDWNAPDVVAARNYLSMLHAQEDADADREAKKLEIELYRNKLIDAETQRQAEKQKAAAYRQTAQIAMLPKEGLGQKFVSAGTFTGSDGTITVPMAGTVTPDIYERLGKYITGKGTAPKPSDYNIPLPKPEMITSEPQLQAALGRLASMTPWNEQQADYQKSLAAQLGAMGEQFAGREKAKAEMAKREALGEALLGFDPSNSGSYGATLSRLAQLGENKLAEIIIDKYKPEPKEKEPTKKDIMNFLLAPEIKYMEVGTDKNGNIIKEPVEIDPSPETITRRKSLLFKSGYGEAPSWEEIMAIVNDPLGTGKIGSYIPPIPPPPAPETIRVGAAEIPIGGMPVSTKKTATATPSMKIINELKSWKNKGVDKATIRKAIIRRWNDLEKEGADPQEILDYFN